MAKVTGFTAERMLAIENSCIVGGAVDLEGRLKLARRDGEIVDGGSIYPSKQVIIDLVAADIIKQIHPIGDVVITTVHTNPASRYGGTWILVGQGRTLVGVDANDPDFNVVKATGGAKTLPAHSHTINHDHAAFTSGAESGHTHTINHNHAAFTSGAESGHTHTINHDHAAFTSGGGGTGTSGNTGLDWPTNNAPGTNKLGVGTQWQGGGVPTILIQQNRSHTHSINVPSFSGTSGASSGHTHSIDVPSFSGTSGASSGHTHSIDVPSFSGTSGVSGSGDHGVVQPYYTVYFWERTG